MPECHLLALCEKSALDHYSNNWSLFTLATTCNIEVDTPPTPDRPMIIPLEIHSHWRFSPEELGNDFEFRYVTSCEQGEFPHPKVFPYNAAKKGVRHRRKSFPVLC